MWGVWPLLRFHTVIVLSWWKKKKKKSWFFFRSFQLLTSFHLENVKRCNDQRWWSLAVKRPQWPSMIANGVWLQGLTGKCSSIKVNSQCKWQYTKKSLHYKITCKFDDLSDWLEDRATALDWLRAKWNGWGSKKGAERKSWRLRGDSSPQ